MIIRWASYSGQSPTPTITIRNEAGAVVGAASYASTNAYGNIYEATVPLASVPTGYYIVTEALSPIGYGSFAIKVIDDTQAIVGETIDALRSVATVTNNVVIPAGTLTSLQRNTNNVIDLYTAESGDYTTSVFYPDGTPVDFSSGSWEIKVQLASTVFTATVSISGIAHNQITFALGTLCNVAILNASFTIRNSTTSVVKIKGTLNVRVAP